MAPRLLLLVVHLVHLVHLTDASRRLASTVDLRTLETQKKNLGTSVHFKLDGAHRLVREGLAPTLAATVARTLACGPATRVFRYAGKHERRIRAAGLHLWYAVACAAPGDGARTLAKFKRFLDREEAAHDGVALAEVSVDAALAWTPNDPKFSDQASHYDAIRLREAWDVETGRSDVIVQVVDTGIDVAHPDLQDAIWTNAGEVCGNGLDDDGNGYVDDCHGYNLLATRWCVSRVGRGRCFATPRRVGRGGCALAPRARTGAHALHFALRVASRSAGGSSPCAPPAARGGTTTRCGVGAGPSRGAPGGGGGGSTGACEGEASGRARAGRRAFGGLDRSRAGRSRSA